MDMPTIFQRCSSLKAPSIKVREDLPRHRIADIDLPASLANAMKHTLALKGCSPGEDARQLYQNTSRTTAAGCA